AMNVDDLGTADGHRILRIPHAKGGSNQVVKIPSHLGSVLDRYLADTGYRSGPMWRSVSANYYGRRLSGSSIYKIVRDLGLSAGLPERVGAHTLRHTGCTLAIEGGATLQQVQTHARHKNIETTMRYVHQRDRLANSAADFIDL
ncbi:MAG: tyrosine-type recombinase/integrase, partial [Bacteroidota bacterium]